MLDVFCYLGAWGLAAAAAGAKEVVCVDSSVPAATEGHFLLWYTGDGEGGASPNRIGFAAGAAGQ